MSKILKSLKSKPVTAIFGLIALVGGFLFLDYGLTGNVVLNTKYTFSMLPLIGLLLIICSIILGAYTLKKRE